MKVFSVVLVLCLFAAIVFQVFYDVLVYSILQLNGGFNWSKFFGQVGGLLNGMRLVGTILGENKKIAIFSSPDGGAFKFEESEAITDSTTLVEIFSEVVIVQDESNNEFEVYMNNVIKPSGG